MSASNCSARRESAGDGAAVSERFGERERERGEERHGRVSGRARARAHLRRAPRKVLARRPEVVVLVARRVRGPGRELAAHEPFLAHEHERGAARPHRGRLGIVHYLRHEFETVGTEVPRTRGARELRDDVGQRDPDLAAIGREIVAAAVEGRRLPRAPRAAARREAHDRVLDRVAEHDGRAGRRRRRHELAERAAAHAAEQLVVLEHADRRSHLEARARDGDLSFIPERETEQADRTSKRACAGRGPSHSALYTSRASTGFAPGTQTGFASVGSPDRMSNSRCT